MCFFFLYKKICNTWKGQKSLKYLRGKIKQKNSKFQISWNQVFDVSIDKWFLFLYFCLNVFADVCRYVDPHTYMQKPHKDAKYPALTLCIIPLGQDLSLNWESWTPPPSTEVTFTHGHPGSLCIFLGSKCKILGFAQPMFLLIEPSPCSLYDLLNLI